MLDVLHDCFFYVCYGVAALILLHRALSPAAAVAVPEETPVGACDVDVPKIDLWITEDLYAKPASMSTTSTTVTLTVDDYSVRQLRQIAKERGNGRIKNYKNISKVSLFRELRSLQLV